MAPWLALIEPVSRLLDRVIPDPDARAKARLELIKEENAGYFRELELALEADRAQIDVNRQEAASASLFVAGWRPFIGWVCGAAFAYHFVLQPWLAFIFAASGHPFATPEFDMDTLTTVLLGLLGLGGLRTIEKMRRR